MNSIIVFFLCIIFFFIGKNFKKILFSFVIFLGLNKKHKKRNDIFAVKKSIKKSRKSKNDDDDEWEEIEEEPEPNNLFEKEEFEDEDIKMIFLVRQDLKMSAGKTAAQVAHAAVELFDLITSGNNKKDQIALDYWSTFGSKKIVLKADDINVLRDCDKKCKEANIPHVLIKDAGYTQVQPGSVTVLGIGPVASNRVDPITGKFKLMH